MSPLPGSLVELIARWQAMSPESRRDMIRHVIPLRVSRGWKRRRARRTSATPPQPARRYPGQPNPSESAQAGRPETEGNRS